MDKLMREEFEKWAEQELLVIFSHPEPDGPLYAPNHTVWLAWKAAWEHPNKESEHG